MPWLGPLLTTSSAALGRLLAVNLLPTAILALVVWLSVKANAFSPSTHDLNLRQLLTGFKVDTAGVLLFIVLVFVLAALLQPFEISAVRILEGYWDRSRVGGAAVKLAGSRHRRRYARAVRDYDADNYVIRMGLLDPAQLSTLPLREQASRHREWAIRCRRARWAKRVRPTYPSAPDDVLPTMLGNVLRVSERRAGERYYLPTVQTLPRLHQHLSDRMAAAFGAAVDALDAAVMMTIATATAGAVAAAAFYNDPSLWWIPIVLFIAACLSYRGAVLAAAQYGTFLEVAFDLHRFDLLKALHLDMPMNPQEEKKLALTIEQFWKSWGVETARKHWRCVKYWHYEDNDRIRSSGASEAPDDEHTRASGYL